MSFASRETEFGMRDEKKGMKMMKNEGEREREKIMLSHLQVIVIVFLLHWNSIQSSFEPFHHSLSRTLSPFSIRRSLPLPSLSDVLSLSLLYPTFSPSFLWFRLSFFLPEDLSSKSCIPPCQEQTMTRQIWYNENNYSMAHHIFEHQPFLSHSHFPSFPPFHSVSSFSPSSDSD